MAEQEKADEFSLGPYSDECGLTLHDLDEPVSAKLRTVKIGLVLEILDNIPSHNPQETAELLIGLSHPDLSIHKSNPNSLRLKIASYVKTRKNFRRHTEYDNISNLLSKDFVPPLPTPQPPPPPSSPVKRTYEELEKENNEFRMQLKHLEEEYDKVNEELEKAITNSNKLNHEVEETVNIHRLKLSSYSQDVNELKRENKRLQKAYASKSDELDKANAKVIALREKANEKSATIKNLRKKVKRDGESSEKKLKQITNLQKQVNEQEVVINVTKEMYETATAEKRVLQKSVSQLKCRKETNKCSLVLQNEEKIKELQRKVKEQDAHIRELEQLNVLLEGDLIKTFEGGKFVNELRETIMILLTECNVSISKVGKVISTVCKNLLGKIPERLPSNGTLHRLLNEAKFVAQVQVYECLEEGGDPSKMIGNTLHSDATTKFHHHYQGFQATLRSGQQITIGVTEVGGGDASTYMDAFKDTIADIAEAVANSPQDKEQVIARLVTSMKNTMGDQGPTNPRFNEQLKQFRETLLPKVVDNWESLTDSTREVMADMGNYFCKMHLLVNFATSADNVLKINEKDVVAEGKNPFAYGSDSGAVRLIRTSAKAFTPHGCDKSGVAADWITYLDQLGKKNKLVTYRGNRFNILFYSAAATYYHRHDIYNFLSSLPDLNNLLKAVQFDIQQKIYLAQVRALGIVDKIITGPFWRAVEAANCIFDLNEPLNKMLQVCKSWAEDATPLLAGETIFEGVDIHQDELYNELFAESGDVDLDTYTQIALEMILTGIILILERQAKDQLQGGVFFAPSDATRRAASNVPCTNNVSERDFAVLDVLVRLKPAASCHAYETYLMWLNNEPSKWLDSMDATKKKTLLDQARNNYPKLRQQYLARKDKLKLQRVKALHTKQQKQEAKEQQDRLNKVAATDSIMHFGGVWTADTLEDQMNNIPPSKRKAAIVSQLKYHRKVLKSKGPSNLFNKSSNKVDFTEEKLKSNLCTVLELNQITSDNVQGNVLTYNTKETMTSKIKQSKSEMLAKVAEQRNKIQSKQQITLLPEYCEHPDKLVGEKVKHKCKEEDGTVEWFGATVIGIYALKSNPLQTEFEVIYDDFPDDKWFFPLLSDLKKGELIIKSSTTNEL